MEQKRDPQDIVQRYFQKKSEWENMQLDQTRSAEDPAEAAAARERVAELTREVEQLEAELDEYRNTAFIKPINKRGE